MPAYFSIYGESVTNGHSHATPLHQPLIPLVFPADGRSTPLTHWQTSTFVPYAVKLKLNWSTAPDDLLFSVMSSQQSGTGSCDAATFKSAPSILPNYAKGP